MRHVALEIPLGAFAIIRSRQRRNAAYAWVQSLRDPLDHAAFARCVPSFKDHNEPVAGIQNPVLQLHEFALQAEQLAEIQLARQSRVFGQTGCAVLDAIVDFQFKFLIVCVDEVLLETALTLGERLHVKGFVCHHDSPMQPGMDSARRVRPRRQHRLSNHEMAFRLPALSEVNLQDQCYGDRTATIHDPFGHEWRLGSLPQRNSGAPVAGCAPTPDRRYIQSGWNVQTTSWSMNVATLAMPAQS